jgi:transitional endoplasmic reticulum ATPase
MKIQRVTTLAFSISEEREKEIENSLKEKKKGKFLGILGKEEKPKIIYAYSPVGKFKATRLEKVIKGLLRDEEFETLECYFYVDLNNLDLFCLHEERGGEIKIERYDIIKKIFNLSDNAIKTLGNLLRYGETFLDNINSNVVDELAHIKAIKIFKPRLKELSAMIIDELTPESPRPTIVKKRVKSKIHIPKFGYRGYNLTEYLHADDTWVESYTPQNIKYSIDKVSRVLGILFQAEVSLIRAVIFMPYIECKFKTEEGKRTRTFERYFPVLCHDEKQKRERIERKKKGVKLVPLSLSTEIGVPECVPVEHPTINFSDVANLEYVKEEIREEIIYPLIRPDLAKEFGRRAGGGILLYGPPGCGKTLIVRAAIGECFASFFNVNLSDLVSKGVEVEPKILHDIFEQARKDAPSVIFIDELDAIGGKKTIEEEHAARMLIDQLLIEMDGIESLEGSILFIAATNTPWAIDPALRRTERFTRQIFVPPPNLKTRIELFKIYTKNEPVDTEKVNFEELAKLTEGYASSDIKAICDLAAKIPWEEAIHGGVKRKITQEDFIKIISQQKSSLPAWFKLAREEIEKSGELKLYEDFSRYILKYAGGIDQSEKPELRFQDVGNLANVKEELKRKIIYPILNPELGEKFKQELGGAILLYGPPGCGKTYITRATICECNAAFFNVRITDIILKERGAPERKIREIFDRAEKNSPAIIFFDEIDALLGRRDLVKTEKKILAQFLMEMDGVEKRRGVFVIGATNIPWAIDPALRRAGRFTTQIFVPPPNLKAREEIFKIHLKERKIAKDVDVKKLASLTEGYSSSDIKTICDLASEIPWEEAIKGGKEREIEMQDFIKVISKQKSSLVPWFKMANKQLLESEEKEIYKDLVNSIAYFEEKIKEIEEGKDKEKLKEVLREEKIKLGICQDRKREEGIASLETEKKRLEEIISTARKRYYQRKIDEESFRRIVKDYEKKLIELDIEIRKLKSEYIKKEFLTKKE